MAILIPNKKKWLRRPTGPVEINWNEPLAKDLLFYTAFINGDYSNLAIDASPNAGTTVGANVGHRDLDGLYLSQTNASYVGSDTILPHTNAAGDSFTVSAAFKYLSKSAGGNPRCVNNLNEALDTLFGVGTGGFIAVYDGLWRASSRLWEVGKDYHVTAIYNPGTTHHELWDKGTQLLTWDGFDEVLGRPTINSNDTDEYFGMIAHSFYVSGRALSNEEVVELNDYPYHFLKKKAGNIFISAPVSPNNTANIPLGTLSIVSNPPQIENETANTSNIPISALTITGIAPSITNAPATHHRYWRVYITANGGHVNFTSVAELEFLDGIAGTDQANGGTPDASSDFGAGYEAAQAFDNVSDGGTLPWVTSFGSEVPSWVSYDLVSQLAVPAFTVVAPATDSEAPRDFELQYSDNNTDWTTTIARVEEPAWAAYESREFSTTTTGDNSSNIPTGALSLAGQSPQISTDNGSYSLLPLATLTLTSNAVTVDNLILLDPPVYGFLNSQHATINPFALNKSCLNSNYDQFSYKNESSNLNSYYVLNSYRNSLGFLDSYHSLFAWKPSNSNLNSAYGIGAYTKVQSKLNAEHSLYVYSSIVGHLNGFASLFSFVVRQSSLSSNYDLNAVLKFYSSLSASYSIDIFKLLKSELDTKYSQFSYVPGISHLSNNNSLNVYDYIRSLLNSKHVISVYELRHGYLNGNHDLSVLTQVVGHLNGSYNLNALEAIHGFLNAYYDLNVNEIAEGIGMAINLSNGAVSKYENYSFNSFSGLRGANSSGIHDLSGDDDSGTPIDALIDFGDLDFGTSKLKRLIDAYLGVDSAGDLTLTVETETGETLYTLTKTDELKTVKTNLAKGHKGRYWRVKVSNVGGSQFELDTLELNENVLSRRV